MDLALDTLSGDLSIVDGDLALVRRGDAVAQHLSQRLKLLLSEWFLDESAGVPYFDLIFVKNPDPTVVDSVLKSVILETPGITKLLEFSLDLDPDTRLLTVNGRAEHADGEIDFRESVGV